MKNAYRLGTSHCYSIAIPTPLVWLTFSKLKKTKQENLKFLSLLPSSLSFWSSSVTQKLHGVCKYLKYQVTALLMGIIPTCLEHRMSYNGPATLSKLSPRCVCLEFLSGHTGTTKYVRYRLRHVGIKEMFDFRCQFSINLVCLRSIYSIQQQMLLRLYNLLMLAV